MALGIGFVLGVISAVSTVAGLEQSRQARKRQDRASRAAQRVAERRSTRERLEQIRAAQISSAQVEAQAGTQGTLESSAVQGGIAGIQTGAAQNIAFINQIGSLQQEQQRNLERARAFAGNAAAFGSFASLAASQSARDVVGELFAKRATPAPVTDVSG